MAEDIPKTDWGPGFSKLHVDKFCGRQTSANRFGPNAPKRIKQMLRGHPNHWTTTLSEFDDDDDDDADGGDDSWEDEEEDDTQDSDGFEQAVDFWGHLGAGGDQSEVSSTASNESFWSKGKKGIPRVARQRLNLTALSQHHDLYFAAYQGEVHVFQPQQAPQILQKPLLTLKPRPTPLADKIGGHIDPINHHQVNHLIIGELGAAEILLFAYDDGDVVAYYTSTIARCATQRQERRPQWTPRPFMKETVGKSAWGLAIHRQSRLIAVSSNLHEVTVFAFALGSKRERGQGPSSRDKTRVQEPAGSTASRSNRLEPPDLERHLRSRERSWRILLSAGNAAQNMPCVSFIDDDNGEAEKVAAIDISGSCWLLDIWKVGSTTIRLRSIDRVQRVGWGVLALPLSSFLPTKYGTHCLGADPQACPRFKAPDHGQHFDTTASLLNVDDNAAHKAVAAARQLREKHDAPLPDPSPRIAQEFQLPDCEEHGYDGVIVHEPAERWERLTAKNIPDVNKAGINFDSEARHGFQQELIAVPCLGFSYQCDDMIKLLQVLRKSGERKTCVLGAILNEVATFDLLGDHLLKTCVLLRSYDARVEVGMLDCRDPVVVCDDVVSQINYHRATPLWDEPWSERLSMLIHVPELNLVVAGSMCGRVALLRLTAGPKGKLPRASFRTEWLLPRESDEKQKLRPYVALLGVAISPIREPGARGLDLMQDAGSGVPRQRPRLPMYPKRWRLILHYIDHTILQYTIQAEEPGADDLAIF